MSNIAITPIGTMLKREIPKGMSKSRAKRLNARLDFNKEISLLLLANGLLNEYFNIGSCKNIDEWYLGKELRDLKIKTKLFAGRSREILQICKNEMDIVESIQRNTTENSLNRFKNKKCNIDDEDDLVINPVALIVTILDGHFFYDRKKITLERNTYKMIEYCTKEVRRLDSFKNGLIVGNMFIKRIYKYYEERKYIL